MKASQPKEERIGGKWSDRLIHSPRFVTLPKTAEGTDFFYFRTHGDQVSGELLGKRANPGQPCAASYRMKAELMRQDGKDLVVPEAGTLIEFPGCAMLQRLIDRNELIGSYIRIVYRGRLRNYGRRSMKVFEVFKQKGIFVDRQEKQDAKVRKRRKRRANGGRGCAATRRRDSLDRNIAEAQRRIDESTGRRGKAERARARGRSQAAAGRGEAAD